MPSLRHATRIRELRSQANSVSPVGYAAHVTEEPRGHTVPSPLLEGPLVERSPRGVSDLKEDVAGFKEDVVGPGRAARPGFADSTFPLDDRGD